MTDSLFQALACMGNASCQMSYANNYVEFVKDVPNELKAEMVQINTEIHRIQELLRLIRNKEVVTR